MQTGIANRAVGETRILVFALNSGPCVHKFNSYIFSKERVFTSIQDIIAICYASLKFVNS